VIGFSTGGQVALYTALEPFRRGVRDDDRRFAAHVALYPYCSDWYTAARVTGAPLLLLLGGRDDYTPAEACRGYAEWFKGAGAETTVVTYPNAYHDFDSERSPRFERGLVTGRGCDMAVDLDHFTVARRGTGEDITATAGRYGRDCLARGATIGGDGEARRRAPRGRRGLPASRAQARDALTASGPSATVAARIASLIPLERRGQGGGNGARSVRS
jgi:acetyl esterase/lipase